MEPSSKGLWLTIGIFAVAGGGLFLWRRFNPRPEVVPGEVVSNPSPSRDLPSNLIHFPAR